MRPIRPIADSWQNATCAAVAASLALAARFAGAAPLDTRTNPTDGAELVRIEAGPFTMGNDAGGRAEQPARTVTLKSYWIYRTEVRAGQYLQFASATHRKPPSEPRYGFHDDRPVVYAGWDEAQWEKAAVGSFRGAMYTTRDWPTSAPG
jgi:formylglycine-generating enzyme required for sulfatase activity